MNILLGENKKKLIFWDLFEKNSAVINETRYYETIKTLLRPAISAKEQKQIEKVVREWQQKTTSVPQEASVVVSGVYDIPQSCLNLFPIYQKNREILETYTAQTLFNRHLDRLPEIAKRYNSLGYTRLPDYVQEAVIISQQATEIPSYYGFEIEYEIKQRCATFLQTLNNFSIRIVSPQTLYKEFGSTYIYYYLATELYLNKQ
jgi:RNase P subunit RPR2